MGNTNQAMKDTLRQYIGSSQNSSPPYQPNEQYNKASAQTLIARNGANEKNGFKSDLDTAKENMESNYKLFLTQYGQYSNQLLQHPTGKDTIQFPFTDLFKDFPTGVVS
jgi:hypothetical protein